MTDPGRTPPPVSQPLSRRSAGALWAVVLGCAAALAGAISGFVLAAHSRVIECPDGTVIEDGQDPNCHAYPDVAQGLAIAFACLALLALIVLATLTFFAVSARAGDQVQ